MEKLKPYGFAIHGCIDGYKNKILTCSGLGTYYVMVFSYSRKVLWLQAGTSDNDPRVVAWHYLQCVKQLKGQ